MSISELIRNLIGQPQNYYIDATQKVHMIYDTEYLLKAGLLFLTIFALFGMILSVIKMFGGRK